MTLSLRGSKTEPRRDSPTNCVKLMCRTGARSRSEVEESRNGPREFRGSCRTGRVHYYDEVGICRHDERVGCIRNRSAQTDYSAIPEIVLAKIRRIVAG